MNNPSINRNNQVNLTTWLKDIEKINKEEETVPANFENVSEYFTNLLNEILSGRGSYFTSYHKKLFKDFCSYLQDDNIVIKRCKPSIVNNITNFNPKFDLRNAKKTGKLKSVTSDLRKLRSQFIAINEIYNSKCFVSQISKSIIKDPSDSYYQRYFIEYLRSRYQTRDVMKIVKGNIAKIFFDHFKFKIHSKIINDEYILQNADQATASLKKNFQTFMKNTLEQENFEDCLKTVFQQDQSWKYIENKLVQDSKGYFKIFNDFEFEKIENLQDLGFRENQVRDLKLLIKNFVVRILSHLIFSTISNLYTNSYSETILSLIKNEYFTRFSQLVIDAINDKDNHHRPTFLIGECFISEFASITSEEEARKIYSDIIENELILFTLAIVKFIIKKSKSELDLYTKLENSLEYKLIILEYLDNLTITVIKRLAKFYEKDRKDLDQRKFVSNLISRVTR